MAAPLYTTDSGLLFHAGKILVVTVGLPARGKTHISRALERYLRWLGVKTTVISLGDYRRKVLGGTQKTPKDYFTLGEKCPETQKLRARVSGGCEQLIWNFFDSGGQVVIYDANNGTRLARQSLAERFDKKGIHVIFLESICDKKEIIEANIRGVKVSSPDYRGWDPEIAVQDYYGRIRDHEFYYQTVEETEWPFIKIFNVGDKIQINKIHGYLQSRIIFFLMNIHNRYRTIYFARSGQSLIEHSYKADSDLSPAGWEYAEKLKDFVLDRRAKTLEARGLNPAERKLVIWTSVRRRAHHTAWPFTTDGALYSSVPSSVSTPQYSHSSPASRNTSPMLAATNARLAAVAASQTMGYSPPPQIPAFDLPDAAFGEPKDSVEEDMKGVSQNVQSARAIMSPVENKRSLSGSSSVKANDVSTNGASPPAGSLMSPPIAPLPPRLFSSIKVIEKQQMSEINPGIWDGLSPDRAQALYPDEWNRYMRDPYAFRAPRAESYHDLCIRLEPVLVELEREQEDLLIIGHASVIRCLLAYLIGLPASEIPAIEVARGDLLEVLPASYGVTYKAYHFWDGPGRRGSIGASAYERKALRSLMGRAASTGAKDVSRSRSRLGGPPPILSRVEPTVSITKDAGPSASPPSIVDVVMVSDEDEGASGAGGAFGNVVANDQANSREKLEDGEDEFDEMHTADPEDELKNFYENYAEDTKWKRKVNVEAEL